MPGRGELVLIATPIGNIADLSPRAREELASVDIVCCEDTRHSGQLFARVGISPKRLLSLHEHNEASRTSEVLAVLAEGRRVALVSDAGMPTISDPGRRVVTAAHEAGVRVTAVPGPSAAVAAMAISGLGHGPFFFQGFPERKGERRRQQLGRLAASDVPSILFESPHRIEALLADLCRACGPSRLLVVCRELTKVHEEVWRGALGDAIHLWPGASARGEFVLVIDGASEDPSPPPRHELAAEVSELVAMGLSRRDAVRDVADRHRLPSRSVYDAVGPAQKRR